MKASLETKANELRALLQQAAAKALELKVGISLIKNEYASTLSFDEWENVSDAFEAASETESQIEQLIDGELGVIDYTLGTLSIPEGVANPS